MSNSSLVCYTKLSPYRTKPRNSKIKGISIHTMAGNGSIEGCGQVFQTTRASSHYGIGSDGRIGQYVLESDRAWCCSHAVDHSVVTIEVASIDVYKEPYRCTEKAYESLINLCVDICKRNGIKKLIWKEGKQYCPAYTGRWDVCNMVPHRYTTDKGKSCPGNYLFGKYGEIAEEVNKRLSASTNQSSSGGATTETPTSYLVKINTDTLNVRKGPGTSYEIATTVKKGQIYTIVQDSNGWGKLKSGAGWIKLSYTKKI